MQITITHRSIKFTELIIAKHHFPLILTHHFVCRRRKESQQEYREHRPSKHPGSHVSHLEDAVKGRGRVGDAHGHEAHHRGDQAGPTNLKHKYLASICYTKDFFVLEHV